MAQSLKVGGGGKALVVGALVEEQDKLSIDRNADGQTGKQKETPKKPLQTN